MGGIEDDKEATTTRSFAYSSFGGGKLVRNRSVRRLRGREARRHVPFRGW